VRRPECSRSGRPAALCAKFTQHDSLLTLLLATGDAEIVENAPGDRYWGCGRDGTGKNRLGALLMELREALRRECKDG
jgi:ribA/ribD-fused uncharacterized protein